MTSRPQQIAEMILDLVGSLPPPEDAAEAYEMTQAFAGLAESMAEGFYGLGEKVREYTNIRDEIPGALEETGDGCGFVADHLRDIPPPRPRKRREDPDERPSWVQPTARPDPREVELGRYMHWRDGQG